MLSIIIIAKNEEKVMPRLLESIRSQDYAGKYEIILSDVSTDATPRIARSFGAKVVKGGLPSRGRNNGAKAGKGDIFLFLDADVILPKGFLRKNFAEFRKKGLDVAAPYSKPFSRHLFDHFVFACFNIWCTLVERTYPHGVGYCIFCTRSLFEKIRGFDEKVIMAEDHEFVKRASKAGKFRMLRSVPIVCDVRRFDKEGRLKLSLKYLAIGFTRFFRGEMQECPYDYDLGGVNLKHISKAK